MATSGSADYTINRSRMITLALMAAGKLEDGETPTASQMADMVDILNMMLKALQRDGLKVFLRKRATVFLEKAKSAYSLGPTAGNATYSYTRTAIKTAGSASDVNINIDSTSGMSANDFVGIVLDDGTSYWTTVSSVTDSDTFVIPSPGLPSAAAIDNYVYFFTTKINRPLRVLHAFVRSATNTDTPVTLISQKDYLDLSSKQSDGRVNQAYYDYQLTNGVLYVWPESDTVTDTLELVVHRPIEDMDASANDFDVPAEWYEAIFYGLSLRAAINFQSPSGVVTPLAAMAESTLEKASNGDIEDVPVYFYPVTR